MRELTPGPATGQKPLLDEPPCDCPKEHLDALQMRMMHPLANSVEGLFKGCPIGVATTLALMAANLVNPANVLPEHRSDCRRCSRIVAETFEKIAKGIRARAFD